ncbi:YccF domain-containing protein [Ignavigranum ruoffiae]|uniref:Uncharacterized membrane protein YccF, DUF307 family n=1 Tax=Ignavigranum ruoffiae TaxID=89093 RepID=A0A1H9EE65_9LACT|nr:YccF domain-containing protein [Ignavigranum ruoffiae]SEQ23857.1 Uncharacterized membrane protein YccF, DUF307 family [Ignavigranum ruoffiae]
MNLLANLIWLIFGGLFDALAWFIIGLLWSITIIGLPIGIQCFKLARLHFWPFGKRVIYSPQVSSLILNILWLCFGGIPIALAELASGVVLCLTIIGIPFGIQQFKLSVLALMPFGAKVVRSSEYYVAVERG